MIYISKNNDGIFHKCPKLNFIYNIWHSENDHFICRLCNTKFPKYLALFFNLKNSYGECNEIRIGNRELFYKDIQKDWIRIDGT